MATGGLSRTALERLASRLPPAELARAEAEVALERARLAQRHCRILAHQSRGAAIAARASFGRPGHDDLFDQAKALHGAAQAAFRAYARARLKAQRLGAAAR